MKKTNLLFMLLAALLSMVGNKVYAYDIAMENEDGVMIYYNYSSDGKELIVQSATKNSETVVIPEEVNYMNRTRKVTGIGDYAFQKCSSLISITIPKSMKSIGYNAFFECNNLSKVIVKDIAAWCNISFGWYYSNPLSYAHHLYSDENTEITDLDIPNSVTSIGHNAFQNCYGLTSVTIPNSVTSIGSNAFAGCWYLTSVTIPNSVTSIEGWAFAACSSLTSVIIPNSVTIIGRGTFQYCTGLTSVTIPNSVRNIENEAFNKCTSLTSVTIGTSVTSIRSQAFDNCPSLTSVHISDLETWCNIYFEDSNSNPLHNAHHLYMGGEEVTNLVIPQNVTNINQFAFADCYELSSVTIPNSVTSIGDEAFRNCTGLTSVTIGTSVTSIGKSAFYDCGILLEVISKIENPFDIGTNTFTDNTYYNATLYVPTGTIDKYKATEGWKKFVFFEEGNGGGSTPPEPSKCAKPTIYYSNGKLSYKSETEGVSFNSTISDTDMGKYRDDEVQLSVTYHISVYASKNGYENSETAEATLCWIEVDPQKEGITEGTPTDAKQLKAMPVLIQANDGQISVEGAPDGTKVAVYDANGMQIGTTISRGGQTIVLTHLTSGTIAIVKIGEKAVKVAMK